MKNSGSRKIAAGRKRPKLEPNPLAARVLHLPGEFPIVGVGASAGGLEAFSELLRHLPEKTGMAFVLVQHLDPTHGSMLKKILSRTTTIPVTEVTDGLVVAPDHIYVIPANTNMFIEHGVLRLNARTQTRGLYLPIDHFFQSLALDRGNRAICVILSGTGSDGSAGSAAIKSAGGIGFAQDDQSAKYSGMPRSAINAGSVDFVLSPAKIAKELTRIGQHPYVARPLDQQDEPSSVAEGRDLANLLCLVRDTSGVDFSLYKPATLQRRINRRMALRRLDTLKEYLRYTKGHPGELAELCQDILIHETTSEEFKSGNEEVLSSNEELQSTNEELETAKEELQSSNEELTTLNQELQDRNNELSVANNDLLNLLNNVNIAVVMVADDLRIRRFTSLARKLLNLIPADIGRRLGEIRPNVDLDHLDRIVRETIDTATPHECEVRGKNAGWYLMRVRPYETAENKIEGAVISFQDIDVLKRQIDEMRSYAETLVENAREAILVLDQDLRVTVANRVFYAEFRVFPEETEGRQVYDLGERQWNIPKLRELLEKITKTNSRIDDFEMQHNFPRLGFRTMLLNARRVEPQGARQVIVLSITDVTERRAHAEEWKRQAALLELTHDSIIVRAFDDKILFWNPAAEKMYEWKREDAIGKICHELLQTEFPKPLEEINAELLRTGRWEGELIHVCGDGRRKTVNSRWALRRTSEGTPEVLEINSDITARRSSEDSLRQLSGYLMRVQDEERRRIARELHDSTGQKLIALKMNLEALRMPLNSAGDTNGLLQQSVELVDETTQDIRTLAQLLHPPLLDEAGLISATRWLVDGFSQRAGIAIDLVVPPEMGRLPENAEIALFRVIQESLNNVHRHAAAKKARIEIKRTPEAVTLEVSDDGKGLRPELGPGAKTVKPSFGVGILGMKERLSQLGGTLEISSNKKKGTTVKAVLPSRERPS